MNSRLLFLKRAEICLCILLVAVASIALSYQITRPLVDYDEAIYANVIVDTLHSGDKVNLNLAGHPWFEKPPLYFWVAMPLVAAFGPQEWTFRLPGIIADILCLLFTYLIVRHLAGSITAAATGFLILLTSPWFYFLAIEARLDPGVVAAILASLLVTLKGWREEKYLLLFFPIIAAGFLIKSIIILLIVPILFIYCIAYGEWKWIRSRYLWIGSFFASLIFLPWHILETIRFGSEFWQTYLFSNLLRTTSTITGTNSVGDYVLPLMIKMPIWFWLCIGIITLFVIEAGFLRRMKHRDYREIGAPLVSALFIFSFFTAAQTHLAAYVLPAYPFLAMFVALFAYHAFSIGQKLWAVILACILVTSGMYYCFSFPWTSFQDEARFANDEKQIGKTYLEHNSAVTSAGLYSLQWDGLDAINFYSGTRIIYADARSPQKTEMIPPFYLVATIEYLNMLYKQVPQELNQFKVAYSGEYLVMLYSQQPFSVGGPAH